MLRRDPSWEKHRIAQEQLVNQKGWIKRLPFIWDVDSAQFDGDEEFYKVLLLCYPEEVVVEGKALWEYDSNAAGKVFSYPVPHHKGGISWELKENMVHGKCKFP